MSSRVLAASIALALFVSPAAAQVRQTVCTDVEGASAPTITLWPGTPSRLVISCGRRYAVVRVERGEEGMRAVGESVLEWGGAGADLFVSTERAIVADVAGGREPDLVLAFAQFHSEGGGARGGAVFSLPIGEGGALGRSTLIARDTVVAMAHADTSGDGRDELLLLDNGEPWAARRAAVSVFSAGRRAYRIDSVAMSPLGLAIDGGRVFVLGDGFNDDRGNHTDPALTISPMHGGALETHAFAQTPEGAVFTDVDRDGTLDLVIFREQRAWVTSLALDHERTVESPTISGMWSSRIFPSPFAVDLDGQGAHAFAVCAEGLRLAQCDTDHCTTQPWQLDECTGVDDVLVADLDGDGTREVAVARRGAEDPSTEELLLMPLLAPGTTAGAPSTSAPFTPGPVTPLH
jgi:hypothetical protein